MRLPLALAAAVAAPMVAANLKTSSSGGVKVVNQCSHAIPLRYVPALGEGVSNGQSTSTTLSPAGQGQNSWSAPFTQLLVSGGWSIKLDTINSWDNIMQFEYTWSSDNLIWYDMSFVNGQESEHPEWEFQCPGCPSLPTKGAYQHATDDANGMQRPAPPDVTITLVLCPGNADSSDSSDPAPAPVPIAPPPAPENPPPPPTTTTPAPPPPPPPPPATPTTLSTTTTTPPGLNLKQAAVQTPSPPPTPSAPDATPSPPPPPPPPEDPAMITVFETKVVLAVVTEFAGATPAGPLKRHEHRHPHGHFRW